MTSTGVFVSVPTRAAARSLVSALRREQRFAICNVVDVPHVLTSRASADRIAARAPTRTRLCRAFGLGEAETDALEELVRDSPPMYDTVIRQVIGLSVTDAPFVLVRSREPGDADRVAALVDRIAELFERPVSSLRVRSDRAAVTELSAHRIARPSPARLDARLDRALLTATIGSPEATERAWVEWRTRVDFDANAFALHEIGPVLYENLRRAGVQDDVTGRLRGLHRRAWYVNQIRSSDAANAIRLLEGDGIQPAVVGDLVSSTLAATAGAVRTVRKAELSVPITDARRACEVLALAGWSPGGHEPVRDALFERRNGVRLRRDAHHVLHLHWRAWPARTASLLATTATHDRVTLHDGVSALTEPPTRQLLRLWCRSSDPEPGHQLRTISDTAELVDRMSARIDVGELRRDCAALGLLEYAEWYEHMVRSTSGAPGWPSHQEACVDRGVS